MSGGLGFVQAGKDAARKNRRMLKHTDKVMSRKVAPHEGSNRVLKFKKPTKEELDAFKAKFHSKRKRENKKLVILSTIISVIVLCVFYLILF